MPSIENPINLEDKQNLQFAGFMDLDGKTKTGNVMIGSIQMVASIATVTDPRIKADSTVLISRKGYYSLMGQLYYTVSAGTLSFLS